MRSNLNRFVAAVAVVLSGGLSMAQRVPATPLVTHDPYFSTWCMRDTLTEDWPRHWTGAIRGMAGMVRVDGKAYRWMGPEHVGAPAAEQVDAQVHATRSVYRFKAGPVAFDVEFLSPTLPDDPDLFSRPVTYVRWDAASGDGEKHDVSVYFDASGEWCTDRPSQNIEWTRLKMDGMEALRMGTAEQPVLERHGDDLRQDWGYFYIAAPGAAASVIAPSGDCRVAFLEEGTLPAADDLDMPRRADANWPVMACVSSATVARGKAADGVIMLAYDDEFSIEYFHRKLRPYWRRGGDGPGELLLKAWKEYGQVRGRAAQWDERVVEQAGKAGGADFVRLCNIAFRQTCAAHKLAADWDGTPLLFSKENFSNGCIATVDVSYPSSPFFLWASPALMEAMLRPVLDYSSSSRWKFPFAPHDLGTYPKANGQVYGGGERTEENQMPVEECGNMLIMVAAYAKVAPSSGLVAKYRATLDTWADYLMAQGLDPSNQLCTDDFAGHLAHNTNLSIKAIVALGAYAQALSTVPGAETWSQELKTRSQEMAAKWESMARDGDHYKLAFDKPGTWSQKYNMVWDRLLGLKLFPPEIAQREMAFYRTKLGKYGLPLDNRETYTKLDWEVWTASLTGNREDFDAIMAPVYVWVRETPTRVPLTDWYQTGGDGKQVGFQARSVVGGVFLPMLSGSSER